MPKKSSKLAKIFNINREAKKFYPSLVVDCPVKSGVPVYHPTKVHNITGKEGVSPFSVIYKQAA